MVRMGDTAIEKCTTRHSPRQQWGDCLLHKRRERQLEIQALDLVLYLALINKF